MNQLLFSIQYEKKYEGISVNYYFLENFSRETMDFPRAYVRPGTHPQYVSLPTPHSSSPVPRGGEKEEPGCVGNGGR